MKKQHTYYLLACLITILTSCSKDWLEAKTDKSLTVPTTLADFQGMLDNVAMMTNTSTSNGEIGSDGHFITDISYQNRAKSVFTDSYIWSKTVRYIGSSTGWGRIYERILYCNIILDGLQSTQFSDRTQNIEYKNIKGQALFQRAISFYEVSRIFAPPYNLNGDNSMPGVILRLTSDITIASKRATTQQTYDRILGDLLEAKDLLPDRPDLLTRASKSAVLALLARIYLSMEDYDNALKYSTEALSIYSTLYDYNNLPATNSNIGRYNAEVIFHAYFSDPFLTSNCLIEKSLYDQYDADDLRKTRFFRVNASTGNITFKGNYEGTTANLFCGLATDELYLIRAECYARDRNVSNAMEDLNALMRKRWDMNVPYPEITATDPEDALRKVLTERKKELILRNVRWSDLRRLNRDPRFAVTLTRTVDGTTYTLEPNSYKYTFPIPDDIIEQTGIAQNPGWEK
ncbi:RagB/SusD family nutrient uptake outer membrane protein [Chitinophaga sp. XS-30]|uniref:RagB/SusD family nutrient uptake outer membrane protein n=1 Tax=Chitinophaga sp. XS-30 TaxID=2604421 RepID=UPI0011DCC2AD|nr:RagB/SusD family nutrient uptake outer membrane protein [Chitinophaga sp. XS-30]QEH39444.1 RagB/SusD family nutrient uptake outer membrane protein [Chitinophaga sp. XS-30]